MKEILYQKFLDDDEKEKLRIRISTAKGKVTDMLIQYESFLNNKWIPIVRYDCAHGFFHRDLLFNGEKEKQSISITSLEDALNYAEQDIKDR